MRKAFPLLLAALILSGSALAYEYHLQTPFPGKNGCFASTVSSPACVIGMQFNPDGSISGYVSYFTIPTGCRFVCPKTWHYEQATWDAQGNFLSYFDIPRPASCSTPTGWCLPSQPIATNGTEQIYAYGPDGVSTTGYDNRVANVYEFGYVDIPAPHYSWVTPNNGYTGQNGELPIPWGHNIVQVAIASDGDLPLNISQVYVYTDPGPGYYNTFGGTATETNDCPLAADGTISVPTGTTCTFTIDYDTTGVTTTSPQGLAYAHLHVLLTTDAGNLPEWIHYYTITGVPGPGGGGDD